MSSLELITNGKPSGNNISRKKTSKGALLDIAALMDAMGGRCMPMLLDRGVVAQSTASGSGLPPQEMPGAWCR